MLFLFVKEIPDGERQASEKSRCGRAWQSRRARPRPQTEQGTHEGNLGARQRNAMGKEAREGGEPMIDIDDLDAEDLACAGLRRADRPGDALDELFAELRREGQADYLRAHVPPRQRNPRQPTLD